MSDTPKTDAFIDRIENACGNYEKVVWPDDCRKLERELNAQNDKLAAIVRWLEANQEDVFRRGLWDALNNLNPSVDARQAQQPTKEAR